MKLNSGFGTILLLSIVSFSFSCGGNNATNNALTSDAGRSTAGRQQDSTIRIEKIKLDQKLGATLEAYSLTKDDNSNAEYNINMDYEEFSFDNSKAFTFRSLEIGNVESLVIYYIKKTELAFCYELEVQNNPNCKALYTEYSSAVGEQTFYKETENTKSHPIFLDEDGEPETDHIIEKLSRIKDSKNGVDYHLIYKENLTTAENKLTVIAVNSTSEKRDEWIKFRSLDMVFE